MFLFGFLVCYKAKVLKLILKIQNKNKKLFSILPVVKRTLYDRYPPSPGQNGHVGKI